MVDAIFRLILNQAWVMINAAAACDDYGSDDYGSDDCGSDDYGSDDCESDDCGNDDCGSDDCEVMTVKRK